MSSKEKNHHQTQITLSFTDQIHKKVLYIAIIQSQCKFKHAIFFTYQFVLNSLIKSVACTML